jgi:hypothetical protein
MKKTLQRLIVLSIAFLLTSCSSGFRPASIGNLTFNYDATVWKHIKNNNENAPLELKDSNDNKISFNVSQESTYQHPLAMISFIESIISADESFQVYLEPNEITVNGTKWYEYGYIYNEGSTTYKVYQRYYGKYYNAASVSYTSTPDKFEGGYDLAIKLMADIKVEDVSNVENETKAKEFLVGEWDLNGKGYLVLSENGAYEWFIDSSKDKNNMHFGTYGCDVENMNMNLLEGDGLYLVLFPESLVIAGETDTSLQYKSDFLISFEDEASIDYSMVNLSNYTLYTITRQ